MSALQTLRGGAVWFLGFRRRGLPERVGDGDIEHVCRVARPAPSGSCLNQREAVILDSDGPGMTADSSHRA